MKPIGPLMREHRLIERMVGLLKAEMQRLERGRASVDFPFIEAAVDFFRTYADRTHHGKEEDILFKALNEKDLVAEHKKTMAQLVREHAQARKMVGGLFDAAAACRRGDSGSLENIKKYLKQLVTLYPKHIEKEDRHFFYPVTEYFSKKEQDAMLQEFWEFDRNMIHEKYRETVEALEHK
jgi:hemerythrin-like domain-containing protein